METDTQKINKQRVLESDTTGSIADDIEFDMKSLVEDDDNRSFAEKFKDFEIDKDSSIFSNDTSIRRQMTDFERKSLYIKIAEMKNLPTPSQHLKKIVNVIRNPDVSVSEIASVIEKDETLVAQILKLINSGLFALREKIKTVEEAIALLGISKLKELVYSVSIMELFSAEMKVEFFHSFSTSALVQHIAKTKKLVVAPSIQLTTLIHDIGKIVLNRFTPKQFKAARIFSQQKQIPMYWAERHIIGLDHSEVTEILLPKWDLTDDIIIPIKNHHKVHITGDFATESYLLKLADYIDNIARERFVSVIDITATNNAGIKITKDEIDELIKYQKEFIENNDGL
jgi:HD-like signal output (HDOD) protein